MERVTAFIQKLQQQLEEKAPADKLLVTVQMLYAELAFKQPEYEPRRSGNVVVMMPAAFTISPGSKNGVADKSNGHAEEDKEKIVEVLKVDEKAIEEELEEIRRNAEAKNSMGSKSKPFLLFDPVQDVPTLAHQTPAPSAPMDINESAGKAPESLNEKLKEGKTELAEKLNEGPIKDLKKGIDVNDRFLFINELFRGDEAMYERSIKTINNFSIFAEAEYWIRRELKIKIGWTDADPAVKQFDQLVRRRFL